MSFNRNFNGRDYGGDNFGGRNYDGGHGFRDQGDRNFGDDYRQRDFHGPIRGGSRGGFDRGGRGDFNRGSRGNFDRGGRGGFSSRGGFGRESFDRGGFRRGGFNRGGDDRYDDDFRGNFRGRGGGPPDRFRGGYGGRDFGNRDFGGRREFGDGPNAEQERPELFSKILFVQSKKFYIDVKENRRGRFIKISEVAPNGQKMRIVMDLVTAVEFNEKLTEFCDVYNKLGPAKPQKSYETEEKIKGECIYKEDKRYFLDLKENHRGRLLKVSMTLPNSTDRAQVVIPAQGMVEIRDVFTHVLQTYSQPEKVDNSLECGSQKYTVETGSNMRGNYLRITEVNGAFHASVTVGEQSWAEFVALVEQAMIEAPTPPHNPLLAVEGSAQPTVSEGGEAEEKMEEVN